MMVVYNHRLELIQRLLSIGHDVVIVAPGSGEETELIEMGVKFIDTYMQNRGMNPFRDLKLISELVTVFRREAPDVILTFYTKTNIYGGIAARICGIPYIENITGLGSAVSGGGLFGKLMLKLYAIAIKDASVVFFQNETNRELFRKNSIYVKRERRLPGSGVGLERFKPLPYPETEDINFVFVSRVLKEKGIDELLEAAREIRREFPGAVFHIVGPYDSNYSGILAKSAEEGDVVVYGKMFDIRPVLEMSHCTVFPSYYAEGMANVLLESAASARPLITTDMPGCRETVEDGVTGLIIRPRDVEDLKEKIRMFIGMSHSEREKMGLEGRRKMEREFSREIVVDAYVEEIDRALGRRKVLGIRDELLGIRC